jgi:hypothetical protein
MWRAVPGRSDSKQAWKGSISCRAEAYCCCRDSSSAWLHAAGAYAGAASDCCCGCCCLAAFCCLVGCCGFVEGAAACGTWYVHGFRGGGHRYGDMIRSHQQRACGGAYPAGLQEGRQLLEGLLTRVGAESSYL